MLELKEINLSKVFPVLKTNQGLIGITTGGFTLVAIIYCIFAIPIFTAKALINPPKLSDAGTSFSQVISGFQAIAAGGGGLIPKTDADIAATIMRSNAVKNRVIEKFNLLKLFKADDIELLRTALDGKVSFIQDMKSGFLEIDVQDKDPKLAAAMANYYIVELGQLINNIAYARANQKYTFYEKQLETALGNLQSASDALKKFSEQNGIIAGQQVQVIAGIASQLQVRLVAAKSQLQSMSYYVSTTNPDYQAQEAQIKSIKDQLDRLNNGAANPDNDVAIPAGLAPDLASQYLNLARDYGFKELVYGVMLKQAKASQLDMLSEVSPLVIQVIDPALVPLHKTKPKRLMILILGVFLGLISGCGIALYRNRNYLLIESKNTDA